jgi:hypothetical protein
MEHGLWIFHAFLGSTGRRFCLPRCLAGILLGGGCSSPIYFHKPETVRKEWGLATYVLGKFDGNYALREGEKGQPIGFRVDDRDYEGFVLGSEDAP